MRYTLSARCLAGQASKENDKNNMHTTLPLKTLAALNNKNTEKTREERSSLAE